MPTGIAEIATILAIAAIALLAGAHAIVTWARYEIDLHNLRLEARRLKNEFERRRNDMLDAEAVHHLSDAAKAA
jgi:hypothetical protein